MRRVLSLMSVALVVAFFGPSFASAQIHPYAKIGIDLNGDFDEPLGFEDRLAYQFGIDAMVADTVGVGGELLYQRASGTETILGIEEKQSASVWEGFGNVTFSPEVSGPVSFYAYVGVGVAHVSVDIEHNGHTEFDDSFTKAAFQVAGGTKLGLFLTELKWVKIFAEDYDSDVYLNFGVRF